MAEDASRKQEKEAQERQHHQQLQEELERQKKQDESVSKRSEIFYQTTIFNYNQIYFRTKTTRKTNDTKKR
jgi:hypothetical protein